MAFGPLHSPRPHPLQQPPVASETNRCQVPRSPVGRGPPGSAGTWLQASLHGPLWHLLGAKHLAKVEKFFPKLGCACSGSASGLSSKRAHLLRFLPSSSCAFSAFKFSVFHPPFSGLTLPVLHAFSLGLFTSRALGIQLPSLLLHAFSLPLVPPVKVCVLAGGLGLGQSFAMEKPLWGHEPESGVHDPLRHPLCRFKGRTEAQPPPPYPQSPPCPCDPGLIWYR